MDRVYDLPYTRRPHPSYTRADPRLRDDQGLGDDHARLLRRLHVLLDHRPPGPDHPVALAGVGPRAKSARWRPTRSSRASSATSAARRPTCTRCAAPGPRSRRSASGCRASTRRSASCWAPTTARSIELMQRARDRAGHPQGARRHRHPHGPGPAVAGVHARAGRAPRRRPPEGRPGAHRPARARADEEAGDRQLRAASPTTFKKASQKAGKPKQYLVPYFIASHPGSDLHAMIDLALFLKRNGYRPDQVQDFIPAPFDIATCMYYTGIDPFTKQAGLRRPQPARPQAAAGPAAVLQAGELLRGPRGADRRPAGRT